MFWGSRFKVQGLGFRAEGLWFRIRFGVVGLGLRSVGVGSKVDLAVPGRERVRPDSVRSRHSHPYSPAQSVGWLPPGPGMRACSLGYFFCIALDTSWILVLNCSRYKLDSCSVLFSIHVQLHPPAINASPTFHGLEDLLNPNMAASRTCFAWLVGPLPSEEGTNSKGLRNFT